VNRDTQLASLLSCPPTLEATLLRLTSLPELTLTKCTTRRCRCALCSRPTYTAQHNVCRATALRLLASAHHIQTSPHASCAENAERIVNKTHAKQRSLRASLHRLTCAKARHASKDSFLHTQAVRADEQRPTTRFKLGTRRSRVAHVLTASTINSLALSFLFFLIVDAVAAHLDSWQHHRTH